MKREITVLLVADTHLGFDYPIHPRVERRRRGEDFFDNFQRVLDYAASTRPALLIHGGDLFFRSRVPRPIVDRVYNMLLDFAHHNIPTYLVPGNHERSNLPVSLWFTHPSIRVFDQPRTFVLDLEGTTVALAGFPFVREGIREGFADVLAQTGWQSVEADLKLLCLHQAVEGARVAGYTFWSGPDVVRRADVPRDFAAVLTGHIHRRQVLGTSARTAWTPVVYPGSVERTSFAERDEPKGFYELKFVPDDGGRWRMEEPCFIELPARPMVDLELPAQTDPASTEGCLRERAAELDPDAIVRIKFGGPSEQAARCGLSAALLRAVLPPTVSVQLGAEFRPRYSRRPEDAGE